MPQTLWRLDDLAGGDVRASGCFDRRVDELAVLGRWLGRDERGTDEEGCRVEQVAGVSGAARKNCSRIVLVASLELDDWWRVYWAAVDCGWSQPRNGMFYSLVSFSSLNEHSRARSGC